MVHNAYHTTSSRYITVLEGIQDLVGDQCDILYSEGCALSSDRVEPLAKANDRIAEALAVAKNSDTVLLVLGLDETLEGEEGDTGNSYFSGDKDNLLLPETQRILMEKVLAVGKPTVVILMAGSSIDLTAAQEKADAVLLTWYPGACGGKAVAELLFGKHSPSGKLPLTFYTNEALAEMPDFTDYSMRNRTYRYYTGKALYPFGYGLTYGDCSVESLSATKTDAAVTVVNTGCNDTDEVLELYLRDEKSPDAPPHPVLCGFRRIHLRAGERAVISVPIDPRAFTIVNQEGFRIPGSGTWTLYAGFGAPDSRTEELTGKKSQSVILTD